VSEGGHTDAVEGRGTLLLAISIHQLLTRTPLSRERESDQGYGTQARPAAGRMYVLFITTVNRTLERELEAAGGSEE